MPEIVIEGHLYDVPEAVCLRMNKLESIANKLIQMRRLQGEKWHTEKQEAIRLKSIKAIKKAVDTFLKEETLNQLFNVTTQKVTKTPLPPPPTNKQQQQQRRRNNGKSTGTNKGALL